MVKNGANAVLDGAAGLMRATGARLVVRSALNAMLLLCVIVTPVSLALAALVRQDRVLMGVLLAFAALPVAIAAGFFVYWGIRHPHFLQSESYQIRHQSLEMMRQGVFGPEVIEAVVAVSGNPSATAALDEGEGL